MDDPGIGKLNRKYSLQQFIIFVPFSIVALDIIQRSRIARMV
jgi:restriction endonuclease